MRTIKQQARRAGWIYLLLGLSAPFGLMYVPGKIFVAGNATATVENLRVSGGLVRLGIASELFHQVVVIFLVLALYRLFKGVSIDLSRQLVILGALVSVPVMFVNVLNEIAALTLVGGADYLKVFEKPELDALAYLFLRLHGQGITVASVFWGLWLFPFGLLVIRSGFIPRVFGYLLLVAGFSYLASSFATLIVPQYSAVSSFTMLLGFCEVPIIFWLLIGGANGPMAEAPAPF
jgi:hypothetical protein